jgi:hypothetical protein
MIQVKKLHVTRMNTSISLIFPLLQPSRQQTGKVKKRAKATSPNLMAGKDDDSSKDKVETEDASFDEGLLFCKFDN